VNVGAATALVTVEAGRVVMGKDAGPDREVIRVGGEDDSGNFVAKDVGDLSVHVPRHEFARAESAGLAAHEQSAGRATRGFRGQNLHSAVAYVPGDPILKMFGRFQPPY
jgi:ClpP class serine protease